MKIADLKRGDSATVVRIDGVGSTKKRLLDLGLTKGCKVTLTRIAPLGDPVEIELRGYRISVRKSEASIVELNNVIRFAPPPNGPRKTVPEPQKTSGETDDDSNNTDASTSDTETKA